MTSHSVVCGVDAGGPTEQRAEPKLGQSQRPSRGRPARIRASVAPTRLSLRSPDTVPVPPILQGGKAFCAPPQGADPTLPSATTVRLLASVSVQGPCC